MQVCVESGGSAFSSSSGTDFDPPTEVAELNSAEENEAPTWISAAGCVIYFAVEGDTTYTARRGNQ